MTISNASFRARLYAGTAAVIALIVLMGTWAVMRAHVQHQELATLRAQNVASAAAVYVSDVIDKSDDEMKFLARLYETSRFKPGASESAVRRQISLEMERRPELRNINFAGADGALWPIAAGDPPVNVADRGYFQASRDGPANALVFSEPIEGRVSGSRVIVMVRRLNAPDGRFAGAVLASLSTDSLAEAFGRFELGTGMLLALGTDKLSVVARRTGARHEAGDGGHSPFSDALRAAVATTPAGGVTTSTSPADGLKRLTVFKHLGQFPFYVLVGTPTATLDRATAWDILGIAVLGVLAALITLVSTVILRGMWDRQDHALAAAEVARERNYMLLRNASDGIHIVDTNGRVLEASDLFCTMLGRTHDEVTLMNVWDWDDRWTREDILDGMRQHLARSGTNIFETVHRQKDGRRFDVEVNTRCIIYDGKPALFCSAREISERKAAENALQASDSRLRRAADAADLGVFDMDTHSMTAWRSLKHSRIFGYDSTEDQWTLAKLLAHVVPDDQDRVRGIIQTSIAAGSPFRWECRIVRTDGTERWIESKGDAAREYPGAPLHLIGTVADITERKQTELELRRANEMLQAMAMRDALTGLLNRRYVDETLPRELSKASRSGYPVSLVMLDIDFFKPVNDTHGHPAGDEVLRSLGGLLSANVRGGDIACRYGGEEFLLVLPNAGAQWALQRAEQLRVLVSGLRVDANGTQIAITVSAGVATFPDSAGTAKLLLAKADEALYAAKHAGRDRVEVASAAQHPGGTG